jgi:hypothetical protein
MIDSKPSRLAGMIAPKGAAVRPAEMPQRVAQEAAAQEPARPLDVSIAPRTGMGVKSLTLRLAEDEYEQLRAFAFKHRTTHQDILAAALREYLRARG